MDFFELMQISTQHLELTSPAAPENLWTIGQYVDLDTDKWVVDFGCGYGRSLALWGQDFGISGVGIDVHSFLAQRAKERISDLKLADRIEIICANAIDYDFEPGKYHVAACLGASFIWGGFRQAIKQMSACLCPGGKLMIGEPYYNQEKIPSELRKFEGDLHTEFELIQIARAEGFDVEFVVRASRDDWDRYVSANWYGLLRWINANPEHPERQYVINYLHKNQDMYFKYQRKLEGWAIYILTPIHYAT